MNQGNAGLLALCVLLGGIAFGVLFVAPRYLTADGDGSAAIGEATVTENAGETGAGETEADEGKRERLTASEDAEAVEQPADEPARQASEDSARDKADDDALAALVDEEIGLPAGSTAQEQLAADAGGQEADGKPAFDLLRVEPDGSTVIAGRAEPGKRLEVMNGDDVIATTDVGPTGDFAAVFDEPLKPGDYQLTLRVTGDGEPASVSDEVATISIPSDDSGELLAMVTKPGKASRVVVRPEADTEPEGAGDVAATAGDGESTQPAGEAEPEPEALAAAPDQDEQGSAGGAQVASSGSSEETVRADGDPLADAVQGTRTSAQEDAAAAERDMAAIEPEVTRDEPSEDAPASMVRIDAVEVEGDELFVAGSAEAGATVRVYANDQVLGDDPVGGEGRFLVEGRLPLAVGGHQIRADLIRRGEVVARALVPFERPSGEVAAAVAAPADDAGGGEEQVAAAPADPRRQADEPAQPLEQGSADPEPSSTPDETLTAESPDDDAGLAEPAPQVAAADQPDAVEPSPRTGAETASTGTEPVAPQTRTVIAAAGDEPVTLQQEALTPTDASVIIRRGDTLWQISRRVYGQGVRYTTIYLANQDQIVDPDRILPGQIFDVPEEALVNAEEVHRRLQAN